MLVEAVERYCEAPAAETTAEAAEICKAERAAEAGETATAGGSTDEPATDEDEPADEVTGTGATTEGADTEPSGTNDAGGHGTDEEFGTDEPQPPAEDGGGSSDGDAENDASNAEDDEPLDARGEPAGEPVLERYDDQDRALDPEASAPASVATIWLHRTLPDPTPVARRLAPGFAKQLAAASKRAGVDWAIVLAAIRAEGHISRWPADRREIRARAKQLRSALRSAGEWEAFLALTGRTAYADQAAALMHYNRAVGLRALVTGLEAAKPKLEQKILADSRLDIYGDGQGDIRARRIDVRVLVLLRYLAERYEQVTVSSLDTGHGVYARPGVVSAHKYGLAVDIAALGGQSILGNSAPGGVTEQAVRDILLLPTELRPKQVISLLGLGGASFPMGDHADHIHVGY